MGRNNIVGAWGEMVAAQYLIKKKYKIQACGFRSRFGEIDIIASDRKFLLFVEVKLRKTASFAQAMEFVDHFKQEKLRKTAQIFLAQHPTKLQPRFDVIEIYAPNGVNTDSPQIHHLENAFE